MVQILIIEKTGIIKETKCVEEKDLYKKCGFTKETNFSKHHTWNVKLNKVQYNVSFYGKTEGRANTENKYDLPPPLDNDLFFGKCALVLHDNEKKLIDLTIKQWNSIYEKLFGGFENMDDTALEDDDEEDELDNVPDNLKTKDGYLKDNFVVDNDELEEDVGGDGDGEEEENNDNFEEEEEFDDEISNNNSFADEELMSDDENENLFDEIGSELSEEQYLYSDDEV